MGFFDDIGAGLKVFAGTVGSVFQGAMQIGQGILSGFEGGGPLGGIIGGVTSAIPAVSGTVERIGGYIHNAQHPDAQTVIDHLAPLHAVKPMIQSIQNLSSDAPDSVKDMALTGAKFDDGLKKTGSVVSAVKLAGGTPLTSHLSHSMSSAVVSEVQKRTGFNPIMTNKLMNPALKGASMLSSTNAHANTVKNLVNYAGAESQSMLHLADRIANPVSNQIIVGSG